MDTLELIQQQKPRRVLQLTEDCHILLWYARKFPWISLEIVHRYFYPKISKSNGFLNKRLNHLVSMGYLHKWKSPFLHYTLSSQGSQYLTYWDSRIRNIKSVYSRAIQSNRYAMEYSDPTDMEPRFQDYTHSNKVIETCLSLARTERFDLVEPLDYVKNKRDTLAVKYYPDILLMQFREKAIFRGLIEIENAPITLEKLVRKLVRNYKESEGVSDLAENLQAQEGRPLGTFHFFLFTAPQFLQYYVKSIRQILGTNFDSSLSDPAWQARWASTYKMEIWAKKLRVDVAAFTRWLQKGRVFFGLLPQDFDFTKADLITYDNPKFYPKFPVPQGMGTDNNVKSFDFAGLLK